MHTIEEAKAIIQKRVVERVGTAFMSFITIHSATLTNAERAAFVSLVNEGGEYCTGILEPLWNKFFPSFCTEETMHKMLIEEVQKYNKEIEEKISKAS